MPRSVAKNLGMTGTVTTERLRELAAFRVEQGCAISLYLGFDPSTSATIPAAGVKFNSLLDEAQKSAFATRRELTHDQKLGLQSDFDRIRTFLTEEFDRSGVHGVAIFAAGLDNFWTVVPLSETVPDDTRVAPDFYVAPLVPLVGRGNGAIVAVIDRERGLLFVLKNGRLAPLADLTEEQPGRHDQGGWSQARFQRHIDELVRDHLRTVADDLDKQLRRGIARHVVVIGPEEARSDFEGLLSQEAKSAVIGMTSGEGHASPTEFLELALPFIEQVRLAEETEILERWQAEAGRNGRAAAGWEETLESASDGRVEILLFQQGIQRQAYQCPKCGRAQAVDGACPLDGTHMEPRDDGVDVAVHRTLAHGGDVHSLTRERAELEPAEGIAALLRF
jgi:peptide chain release factor subunit 1